MDSYVLINTPAAAVYAAPSRTKQDEKGFCISTVSDEGLYGNVCRLLKEESDCLYILSSYGYAGYIDKNAVLPASGPEIREWLDNAQVVDGTCVDILTAPTVHGNCLLTLPRGALVKPLEQAEDGYTKVCLANGTTGYIASNCLMEKRFGEDLLMEDPSLLIGLQENAVSERERETGGKDGFDFKKILDKWYGGYNAESADIIADTAFYADTSDTAFSADTAAGTVLSYEEKEAAFRKDLVCTAKKYLGIQYRWGGRSSFGIDCSGLTHMSYLLCGVHIFRDAAIVKNYPLKRLELKWTDHRFDLSNLNSNVLKPGDALYFPGHVAMYLEDGLYIHSTGKAGDMGVVINSLRPGHPRFRADLLEKLYAAAGLRL